MTTQQTTIDLKRTPSSLVNLCFDAFLHHPAKYENVKFITLLLEIRILFVSHLRAYLCDKMFDERSQSPLKPPPDEERKREILREWIALLELSYSPILDLSTKPTQNVLRNQVFHLHDVGSSLRRSQGLQKSVDSIRQSIGDMDLTQSTDSYTQNQDDDFEIVDDEDDLTSNYLLRSLMQDIKALILVSPRTNPQEDTDPEEDLRKKEEFELMTPDLLFEVLRLCQELISVRLEGSSVNDSVLDMISYLPKIRKLDLSNCWNFDENSLSKALRNLFLNKEDATLVTLSLSGCPLVTDRLLGTLKTFPGISHLEELNVAKCTKLLPSSYGKLKELSLKKLKVSHVTNKSLVEIGKIGSLTELDMRHFEAVTDKGVQQFMKTNDLSVLRTLKIKGVHISDDVFVFALKELKNLTSLELIDFHIGEMKGVKSGPMINVQNLTVQSDCIHDDALRKFIGLFPSLTMLTFDVNPYVNGTVFQTIAHKLTSLQHFTWPFGTTRSTFVPNHPQNCFLSLESISSERLQWLRLRKHSVPKLWHIYQLEFHHLFIHDDLMPSITKLTLGSGRYELRPQSFFDHSYLRNLVNLSHLVIHEGYFAKSYSDNLEIFSLFKECAPNLEVLQLSAPQYWDHSINKKLNEEFASRAVPMEIRFEMLPPDELRKMNIKKDSNRRRVLPRKHTLAIVDNFSVT